MIITIRIAHCKQRDGFTCFSREVYETSGRMPTQGGSHVASADTLEEARAEIDRRIRDDWRTAGKDIPPIVECGKIRRDFGFHHVY